MSRILQPITSCLKMGENKEEEKVAPEKDMKDTIVGDPAPSSSMLWKMSSQIYNIGSGAVGLGVGGVKWAASTTYTVGTTVGTGVLTTAQTVVSKVVPSAIPKPKKE